MALKGGSDLEFVSMTKICMTLSSLLLISFFINYSYAEGNGTYKVNFESIIINNLHSDGSEKQTDWDLDVYVNEKRMRLNPGGELLNIVKGVEIPLGIEEEFSVPHNDSLRILTIGIKENIGVNKGLEDLTFNISGIKAKLGVDAASVEIDFERFLQSVSSLVTKNTVKDNSPTGVISKVYTNKNDFGVGRHVDCSSINRALPTLLEQQQTACDFILKYSIVREHKDPVYKTWENSSSILINDKEIDSIPSVMSNGPGKMDLFALGNDGILWHKGYDFGWSGWEPLTTYSNFPGILVPSKSKVEILSWGPERIDVFVRGVDNSTWYNWFVTATGKWNSGWLNVKGNFSTDPSTYSQGPNNLTLFNLDKKGSLCYSKYNPSNQFLTGWESNKKTECNNNKETKGPIGAIPNESTFYDMSHLLDDFCRYSKWIDPDCTGIRILGIPPTNPSSVNSDSNQISYRPPPSICTIGLECTIVDNLEKYRISQPPTIIATNHNRTDIFFLDNGKIMHGYYTIGKSGDWEFSNYTSIFDHYSFGYEPSVVSKSKTHVDIELFSQLSNGSLVQSNYDGNNWTQLNVLGNISSPVSIVHFDHPNQTIVFWKDDNFIKYKILGFDFVEDSSLPSITNKTKSMNEILLQMLDSLF